MVGYNLLVLGTFCAVAATVALVVAAGALLYIASVASNLDKTYPFSRIAYSLYKLVELAEERAADEPKTDEHKTDEPEDGAADGIH